MISDFPLPSEGGPQYTAFVDLPPTFQIEQSEAYKDGSYDYGLSSDVPVLRWRAEYNENLREGEAQILDSHYNEAGGATGGFTMTHPRTGVIYRNVHYESFENPGHEHVDNQTRTVGLMWVLAEYLLIDEFTRASFIGALTRQPDETELSDWRTALEAAHAEGQEALLTEARGLLTTLFECSEYVALGRTDEEYVSDLYWSLMGRAVDESGAATWLGVVTADGRPAALTGLMESEEFTDRVATVYPAR